MLDNRQMQQLFRKPLFSKETTSRDDKFFDASLQTINSVIWNKPYSSGIWNLLLHDKEISACMEMAQFTTVSRLGMNDHGRVHAVIATAAAVKIFDLLIGAGIEPDLVLSGMGDVDDAYLVVITAAFCHDLGNMIHREGHISHSIMLAKPILDRILPEIYSDRDIQYRMRSWILSAIYTHHGEPRPLTLEAAAVCIGDATDMTTGRGRAAFDCGSVTIHTVSALSIEEVMFSRGSHRPVEIEILMSNSAGIYQVQEVLGPKIQAGPAGKYIEVTASVRSDLGEKCIVDRIQLVDGVSKPLARDT